MIKIKEKEKTQISPHFFVINIGGNISTSDHNKGPDLLRLLCCQRGMMAKSFSSFPLLVDGFIFVDVITSYLAVRSFVRCAMMVWGRCKEHVC